MTRSRGTTGREPNAMERAAIRAAAMRDGEPRFVERKPWDDGEVADEPFAPDAMMLDDHGEAIDSAAWRRWRAA